MDDLDRWTRVMPLGVGAFGEVHLAWDTVERRWVALKRFTGQDELGLLRMVIESRIRVSHPHLVRTLAFRLVDDRAWLVTELARGGSLRALVSRVGVLPWGWVAEAVDQILAALTALHATGVVHRDLKPANLLLGSFGATSPHILVGDFGIATWRTVSMTGIGAAIGTPGYLAPEYLDGHQPSPATDLFAVGVLAAELLTGQRLVHYSNASPTMPATWHDVLPVPAEVPHQLAAVLQRMADPDPARRYKDCGQAREALLTATPPNRRGDLTAVTTPDLLASVPPGWTPEGPEQPTTTLLTHPDVDPEPPNLTALPIDGGATELVLEDLATQASPPPTPPDEWQSGSSTQLPGNSAAAPTTSPTGPPTQLAGNSAIPSATPQTATGAAPSGDPAISPPTPSSGLSTQPPSGSATSPAARRKARRRRKVKLAGLLLVLLVLAGGAGTLWWAATHRAIAGQAARVGGSTEAGEEASSPWTPTIVAGCSKVELDRERTTAGGDTERCQRTPDLDPPQHWVKEPPGGFPKSNAAGPFPGETCAINGDRDYSPVGDHVACTEGIWQVIA